MIMRYWLMIIILMFSAYGAYIVLTHTHLPYAENSLEYFLILIAPWILLIGSLKAWHRCFVWRRMLQERQSPPVLSRGQYHSQKTKTRPGILEQSCFLFFLLSVAAILKQFSVSHIEWWISSALGAYFILRRFITRIG